MWPRYIVSATTGMGDVGEFGWKFATTWTGA
jgi:hypothetical protein